MKNSASNLNIDEADREFIQSPISVRNILILIRGLSDCRFLCLSLRNVE